MKKLAILGTSAVLAAVPAMGVFAEVTPVDQTDTLKVTVQESCELAITGDGGINHEDTMTVGQFHDSIAGSKFTIECNAGTGWKLQAEGAGEGDVTNALHDATNGDIVSTAPKTNLKADTATSDWGFKLAKEGDTTIEAGYDDWSAVPTTAQDVAHGTDLAGSDTISVTYGVAISGTQKAGTYQGKVKFTLSEPAS